jgi:GNAT superfamily N-acetyltransferase
MAEGLEIREAEPGDAPSIAEIHLAARREAMPWLHPAHTDDETRDYFARVIGDRPSAWWVARSKDKTVGYMLIDGEAVGHLYVRPGWQRRGIGLALLTKAKALSPGRLELWTFQRNADARAFYEAQGFRAAASTDGRNGENEPDVKYEWVRKGSRPTPSVPPGAGRGVRGRAPAPNGPSQRRRGRRRR